MGQRRLKALLHEAVAQHDRPRSPRQECGQHCTTCLFPPTCDCQEGRQDECAHSELPPHDLARWSPLLVAMAASKFGVMHKDQAACSLGHAPPATHRGDAATSTIPTPCLEACLDVFAQRHVRRRRRCPPMHGRSHWGAATSRNGDVHPTSLVGGAKSGGGAEAHGAPEGALRELCYERCTPCLFNRQAPGGQDTQATTNPNTRGDPSRQPLERAYMRAAA